VKVQRELEAEDSGDGDEDQPGSTG
jgi:hypothetical protein